MQRCGLYQAQLKVLTDNFFGAFLPQAGSLRSMLCKPSLSLCSNSAPRRSEGVCSFIYNAQNIVLLMVVVYRRVSRCPYFKTGQPAETFFLYKPSALDTNAGSAFRSR